MLDFPNSPTTNQTWTATNGVQYQWDGTKWIMTGASGGSGYITDAPSDGNSYGRLNATWNPVLSLSGGGTVTGVTNFTNVSYNMLASGAVGDGATDDTAKIQTWLNSLPVGVEVVLPANHQFLINSADLTIPAGTTIVGQGAMETGNNLAGPAFILNPNYRIIALGAVRLSNFKILRQGLLSSPTTAQANAAVAAWAAEAPLLKTNAVVNSGNTLPFANTTGVTVGMRASGGVVGAYNQTVTAVTPTSVTVSQITAPYPIQPGAYVRFGNSVALYLCVNCAGITLDRLFIMGFNTAIHSETGRSYIDSIEADCTMAMYLTHAGDASYISKVHCIPYYGGDWSKRPGPNYLLTGSDGFYLESCTSVGWATGFVLAGVGGVTLNRCWTETTTDGVTVCTGFRTEGAIGNEVSLIGCVGSGSVAFDFQHYAGFAALIGCTSADGGGDVTKIAHYRLGAMSSGQITSSEIIYTGITPFVVQPSVGVWRINTPQIYNQPNPWMSGAAADLKNITIFGGPALNGANNNLTIDTSGTLALQPNGGASTFGGQVQANSFYAGMGNTLTFAGAQTTTQYGFLYVGNLAGNAPAGASVNYITIPTDNASLPANSTGLSWLSIGGNFGGPQMSGSRAGLNVAIHYVGPNASATDGDRQWQASFSQFNASASAGGTAPHLGSSAGYGYSGGDLALLLSGSTNWSAIIGREIDVGINTGASAAMRLGLSVVSYSTLQGTDKDHAITVGAASGAPGFIYAYTLGDGALDPTNGVVLGYQGTPANPTAKSGVDLSAYTFSNAAFLSTGFTVSGAGHVSVGNGLDVSGTATFHSAVSTSWGPVIQWNSSNNVSYSAYGFWDSQTATGFGMFAYTSSQLVFGKTNQYGTGTQAQITFDINAATIYPAGGLKFGLVNSDPAAVTGGIEMYPGYGGFGVTAGTLNYNWTGVHKFWASGTEILALASGGIYMVAPIGFNNATPIAKPTVTGAKGGNAALGSLLSALANYGLVTDSTTA